MNGVPLAVWRKVAAGVLVFLGALFLFTGVPLTFLWFFNFGPVFWYHLAGPASLVLAWACVAGAVEVAFPERR